MCINSFYKQMVDSKAEFNAVVATYNGHFAVISATIV